MEKGTIPELLDDDGGVGELPAGPVAAVDLLQLGGRAILAGAGSLHGFQPIRLHHLHSFRDLGASEYPSRKKRTWTEQSVVGVGRGTAVQWALVQKVSGRR